jgi:urea transporter
MQEKLAMYEGAVPEPARSVLRGLGQIFFQENALTGICFALGLLVSSPIIALGGLAGAAIGTLTARLAKFPDGEIRAGLYGFNASLVGMVAFFFFLPGASSFGLLLVGSAVATFLTRALRLYLPFPTYTSPFVLTAWVMFLLGPSLGAAWVGPGDPYTGRNVIMAVANGISQVMFQANWLTALLFVIGIALSDWRHAVWVVAASAVGVLVANYHVTPAQRALDPERLVQRFLQENISMGLYSYNATLPALALFLWRKSLIPALLGVLISVPLTELVPMIGLPALTAPFILATWIVLALGAFDERFLSGRILGAAPPNGIQPSTPPEASTS